LNDLNQKVGSTILDQWGNFTNETGLDLSYDTVKHYKDNSGHDIEIQPSTLRKYKTIQKSEKKNQNRLLESLEMSKAIYRNDKSGRHPVNLNDIKDNERIVLDDYYDADNGYMDELINNDPDIYGALGRFKLKSKSNLEFVKTGNKLLPYGYVDHTIIDNYDFNPGTPLGLLINTIEDANKAKSYKIKSRWKTRPIGVIDIKDNKLDTSGIIWDPQF